jgi:hypothetical protein
LTTLAASAPIKVPKTLSSPEANTKEDKLFVCPLPEVKKPLSSPEANIKEVKSYVYPIPLFTKNETAKKKKLVELCSFAMNNAKMGDTLEVIGKTFKSGRTGVTRICLEYWSYYMDDPRRWEFYEALRIAEKVELYNTAL